MTRAAKIFAAVFIAVWAAGFFSAVARADEGAEMGRRVQELLRAHQGDVFGCVRATHVKADGEVLVRVFVGEGGRSVGRADVLKDQSGGGPLAECLLAKIRAWDLSSLGAGEGDQVVFPLAFKPGRDYRTPADSPWSGGERTLTPDGARVRAALERIAPAKKNREWPAGHAQALYVFDGKIEVNGARAAAGEVVWLDGRNPIALRALESRPALLLRVEAAGENRINEANSATGTKSTSGANPASAVVVRRPADAPPLAIAGGRAGARLFLDGLGAPFALDELSAEAGVAIPPHRHDGSDEFIFVRSGRAVTTIEGERVPTNPDDAIFIPSGAEHSLAVDEKLTAVQVYAPGGPEQRFKQSGAKK